MTRQLRPGPGGGRAPRRSGRRAGESGTREAILAAARAQFADRGYNGATIRAIAAAAAVDPALVHHFYGSKEQLFVAAMRLPVVPSEVLTAALAAGRRDPAVSPGVHMVRTVLGVWEREDVRGPFLGLLRSAVTSEQAAGMLREFITEAILGPVAAAAGPGGPVGPSGPSGPIGPVGPVGPSSPGGPVGPSSPGGPVGPSSPGGPVGPGGSDGPDDADSPGGAGGPAGAGGAVGSDGSDCADSPGGPAGADSSGGPAGPGGAAAADADQARPEFRAALAASQMVGLALTRYVLALGPIAAASADDLAAAIGPTLERYLAGDIRAPGGSVPGGGSAPGGGGAPGGGSAASGIRAPGDGVPGGGNAPGEAGQGGASQR